MEIFALETIEFLRKHSNLYDFKMVNVFAHLERIDLQVLTDVEQQDYFIKKSIELTEQGEALLTPYTNKNEILFHKPPKKWSFKKYKEVICLHEFVNSSFSSNLSLVDVGAGLGYLTSLLSNEFKIYAIEKNQSFTKNYSSAVEEIFNIELSEDIVNELKCIKENKIVLVGLHCCGDLTTNCLKAFVESTQVHALGIVSCCYHKMHNGSPISKRFHGLAYGTYFLRLASQRRGDQWFKRGKEIEVNEVFNRGLTEMANINLISVGSSEYEIMYQNNLQKKELIFHLLKLQSHLQRLSELVVQLDRLSYLQEKGFSNVKIFSRVLPESVTPRGEVIFAKK